MAQKFFAITAPAVRDTGVVSAQFINASGAPPRVLLLAERYGTLILGQRKWQLHTKTDGSRPRTGKEYWGSGNATEGELDLQGLLREASNAVLLMPAEIFARFAQACKAADVELEAHHAGCELATG